MDRSDIVMACICDFAAQVRGKGFVSDQSESIQASGIGLAPTNLMINAMGGIPRTPWGPRGEILMMPDPSTEVDLRHAEEIAPERFVLCDLVNFDNTPWDCCPRNWLRRGADALLDEFGLRLKVAFEHEFHYSGASARLGDAYALDAMRLAGAFPQALIEALQQNRIRPQMFMPEYGPQQYEITCAPNESLEAADTAVRLREITRSVARAFDQKATFAPIMKKDMVGNGVHIHFSLMDEAGEPVTYDPGDGLKMSENAARFVAGILNSMPAICALTAASPVSYERLKPHRWSATYNNIAYADREAGVRICPVSTVGGKRPEDGFNLEYRAADSTSNPYIALGSLIHAGLHGLRRQLPLPKATTSDPEELSESEIARMGLKRLPQNLAEALDLLEFSEDLIEWMGPEFHGAYIMHKRGELEQLSEDSIEAQIAKYAECY